MTIATLALATNNCPVATTTLKDRLREAMAYAGVNQKTLEQTAKLTKGYMSRPLSGGRERIDPAILQRIADACDVSYTWLATGRGTMLYAEPDRANVAPREVALEPDDPALASIDDTQSPLEAARVWLDAAAAMRRRKEPVTTESLLVRVTLGKSSAHAERVTAERNAALNHEARERARAAGMLPPDEESEPTK